jgi:hypothetical protein
MYYSFSGNHNGQIEYFDRLNDGTSKLFLPDHKSSCRVYSIQTEEYDQVLYCIKNHGFLDLSEILRNSDSHPWPKILKYN